MIKHFIAALTFLLVAQVAVAASGPTPNCQANGSNTVCTPLIGNVQAADQNLSLDQRPPAQTDDSAHDYANPYALWAWHKPNGTTWVYQQFVNNPGYPVWQPLNLNQNPLPGNATSQAPAVEYWTRQVDQNYVGPLFHVTFADATGLDVQQLADGQPDKGTLWGYTVLHGGPARLDTWHDQSGHGYDCIPTTSANQPMIESDKDGDLVVVWDQWTGATQNTRNCAMSNSLTLTQNTMSAFTVTATRNIIGQGNGVTLFQFGNISGTHANDLLELFTAGATGLNLHAITGSTANYTSASPGLTYLITGTSPTNVTIGTDGFAPFSAVINAGANTLTGGMLGMIPSSATSPSSVTAMGMYQYGVIAYASTLSAADISAEKIAIHALGKTTPQARCNVIAIGESNTEGVNTSYEQSWIAQLQNSLPKSVRIFNFGWSSTGLGVAGGGTANNVYVLEHYAYLPTNATDRCNILLINGGNTNDYYVTVGNPPVSVATEQGYIDAMADWATTNFPGRFNKIFVLTPIDRPGGSAAFYTQLSAMTPSILADAAAHNYTPIRLDQDPTLGSVNSSSANAAIFVGPHMTPEGAAVFANDVKNAIAPFIQPGG